MSGYGVIQSVQKRRMEYEMRLENSQPNEQPSRQSSEPMSRQPDPSEASYGPGNVTTVRQMNTGDNKRKPQGEEGLRRMQRKTGFWSSSPEWADYLIEAIMSAARNFFCGSGRGDTQANVVLNNPTASRIPRANKSTRPFSIAAKQRRTF